MDVEKNDFQMILVIRERDNTWIRERDNTWDPGRANSGITD